MKTRPFCLKKLDKLEKELMGKLYKKGKVGVRGRNLIIHYSKVYKARNGKTGKLMALKRIRMKTEKDGVKSQ